MIRLQRTNSDNSDFQALVHRLDADLKIRDGDEHAFFNQYNKIDTIKHVVIAYSNNKPLGCGAFKAFSDDTTEIKRMYTSEEARGKGIATAVLKELEAWAREKGFSNMILETGFRMPEAIALYTKYGFERTENYGQYQGVEASRCFLKKL